jgi:hypothetical protein
MPGSFHSQFSLDALDDGTLASWQTALRLAAEKGGRVWIAEDGEVVAQLILTSALAGDLPGHGTPARRTG